MRIVVRMILAAFLTATAAMAEDSKASDFNGISVGKPKVFDNRTLTIMLESLSQTLQSIQAQQFVDQKALSAALMTIQGSRSTETNTALSLLGLPVPSVTETLNTTAGNTTTAGEPRPDTLTTATTTTHAAITPAAPTLTEVPAFTGFTPNFGQAAGDLLNDSINLNYQIFNLRMILERSLSDRLIGNSARIQAVLGFNITIDPPRTAVDSVAVVEITLTADSDDVSLVALMPQEKTYNAATLSTKSNAFGGSAIVNTFQVGVNTRRRAQTFYLYRDTDTIAYERMNPEEPKQLVFGWMFRPVLGRRSVSPGFRQLFAIAALPGGDCADAQKCPTKTLTARVRTSWKRYDRDTLTSFDDKDVNRSARFKYAATLGLTKPQIFHSRYRNERTYHDVTVKTTNGYEENLRPTLADVSWSPVGTKNALITVTGANLFTGTQVVLGDKTYTGGDGLVLKSNNTLELTTSLDALSAGNAMVSGRYGSAVPLISKDPLANSPGALIRRVEIGSAIAGTHMLSIFLRSRKEASPLHVEDLPGDPHPLLVTINGHAVSQPYVIFQEKEDSVVVRSSFPSTFLSGGTVAVQVVWPFLPAERWLLVHRFVPPSLQYEIVRVGEKSFMLLSKNDAGFVNRVDDPKVPLSATECWQLFVGDKPFKLKTAVCSSGDDQSEPAGTNAVAVTLTKAVPDRIALLEPILGAVFTFDVPKVVAPKSDAPAPAEKPPSIAQFDSVFVDVTVDKAANVGSVSANQQPLVFAPKSEKADETKIKVHITRELSSKPGNVDMTVVDKQGKSTVARLVIEPCANCKSEGGK